MPKPTDIGLRNAMVVLERAGMTQGAIARELRVARCTVNRVLARYRRTRDVVPGKSTGRPRITTARQDRFLLRQVRQKRTLSARLLQGRLRAHLGIHLCRKTVNNRLLAHGYRSRRPLRFPKMTLEHRRQRREWARRFHNLALPHWRHVIFADESRFLLYPKDGRMRVRRLQGEVLNEDCMAENVAFGGGSVHIWGAFCYDGKAPLVVLDVNVTGLVYRDIMQNTLVPYARGMFQHNFRYQDDNARPHRSRVVVDYLTQEGILGMDQPPKSPDVNPIEHLWSDMSRELSTMDNPPQTLPELRRVLRQIWADITHDRLQTLVDSMPRRLEAVIAARGGPTRY